MEKTHYRKAFNSPYLSSADVVGDTVLTIKNVRLEPDKTKKTKDKFNTAYFVESEIRKGETLKPMILNAGNSKTLRLITDSPFIEDWNNIKVVVYVDYNVRFGRDTVEGLRLKEYTLNLTPEQEQNVSGWISTMKAEVEHGASRQDCWMKHKADVITECGTDGAKLVHKEVFKK